MRGRVGGASDSAYGARSVNVRDSGWTGAVAAAAAMNVTEHLRCVCLIASLQTNAINTTIECVCFVTENCIIKLSKKNLFTSQTIRYKYRTYFIPLKGCNCSNIWYNLNKSKFYVGRN
jgi:hypothetical protein